MTLYDILGVMPGASVQQIERAYQARLRLLGPDMISGAAPAVLAAADRARAAAEQSWRVLSDPAARARYDQRAGLRSPGTGLAAPAPIPSEPGWDWDGPDDDNLLAACGALDALAGWLAPHPGPSRRVVVPDVRGLFTGPCQRAVGSADLRLEMVLLTRNPMPVEGLIVDQSPAGGTRVRRSTILTVRVWHPARPAGRPPGR